MNYASPVLVVVYVIAIGSSAYFFYLGRELSVPKRILVSLHGFLAVAILPSLSLFAVGLGAGFLIVGVLSILSVSSIIYSIVTLRGNWKVHLLHIVTVYVLWISMAIFLLSNHGS